MLLKVLKIRITIIAIMPAGIEIDDSSQNRSPHKNPLRAQIYCFIWNKARGREYKSAHRKPIFDRPENLLHHCNCTGNKQAETHPSCLLKMRDTLPPSCWRFAEWLTAACLEDAGAKIGIPNHPTCLCCSYHAKPASHNRPHTKAIHKSLGQPY